MTSDTRRMPADERCAQSSIKWIIETGVAVTGAVVGLLRLIG